MEKFSVTQSGNLIALAGFIVMVLHHYQINIAQEDIVAILGGIITIVGIARSWYGRYRQGDLTLAGFRK
mgnify:CR=1 FL=1